MPSIFVSYSRKDESLARRLAASLSDLNADIWIDVDDIPAGKKWSSAIQQGLDSADLMILVISPDSMASHNVEDEWQYFLDSRKPVIPVLARPARIQFQLNRVQYVDFHNQSYEAAFSELVRKLAEQGVRLQPVSIPAAPPLRPATVPAGTPPRRVGLLVTGAVAILLIIGAAVLFASQASQMELIRLTNEALVVVTQTLAASPLSPQPSATTALTPRVTARDETSVMGGDGSEFPVVARMSKGESALALGVGQGGYFIQLDDGRRGWVNSGNVDLNVPLSRLSFIDDSTLPTATSAVPSAAPVTNQIVFVSDREGNQDIFRLDFNTRVVSNLTRTEHSETDPAWSPDGRQLVYIDDRNGIPNIYMMNADGTGVREFTDLGYAESNPAWSPDGLWIAYAAEVIGGWEVYRVDAELRQKDQNLSMSGGDDRAPAWSPDGGRIAFEATRRGSAEIWVMKADGSNQQPLTITYEQHNDLSPAWSPDGSKIAFISDRGGNFNLYMMDASGGEMHQITASGGYHGSPSWSPDGSKIAFDWKQDTNDPNDKWVIAYVDLATGTESVLTDKSSDSTNPAWSPQ
jgi:hypothetical protein